MLHGSRGMQRSPINRPDTMHANVAVSWTAREKSRPYHPFEIVCILHMAMDVTISAADRLLRQTFVVDRNHGTQDGELQTRRYSHAR